MEFTTDSSSLSSIGILMMIGMVCIRMLWIVELGSKVPIVSKLLRAFLN